jgi:hypothetical protein
MVKTLVLTGVLCLLAQDKAPVSISADSPTDTTWPILGKANRPNGTVVKVSATRLERRWDPVVERFRESVSPEFRIARSAEIDARAFKATLKAGPVGIYELVVVEGEARLHTERILLGRPAELAAATRKSVAKLVELIDRATANLDQIEKILAGKLPGTSKDREAFIKRVHGEEQLLQELATKSDLTGSVALLTEICSQIRNAQVWQQPAGKGDEELNDTTGEKRDVFLDPKLTFKSLHAILDGTRAVISRELVLSTATILELGFARAEEKPDRLLQKARDTAAEALKTLLLAPVEDKEARAAIESAERTEPAQIAEVRKSLRALASKHLADP